MVFMSTSALPSGDKHLAAAGMYQATETQKAEAKNPRY